MSKRMKEYRVYFTARVYDSIVVEANSEDEAEQIAENLKGSLDTTAEVLEWNIEYAEEE